jgi:hypothetical protein
MKWTFLAPRSYQVQLTASIAEVDAVLDRHINSLQVQDGFWDSGTNIVNNSYTGNGAFFVIDREVNMGGGNIWIHATGDGKQEGKNTILDIVYIVGPRWIVFGLWFFTGVGILALFLSLIALFRGQLEWKDANVFLVPMLFLVVVLIINLSYQNQITRLHKEVKKAFKTIAVKK